MGRESIHSKIDELLDVLSINNSRLSLHSEGLSMLDIDVLRKQCIELYEQINKLALQPKTVPKLAEKLVEIKEKPVEKEQEAKPFEEIVNKEPEVVVPEPPIVDMPIEVKAPEVVEPKTVSSVEKIVPKESEPISLPKDNVKAKDDTKSHRYENEEMRSLFEKFSSKPIESIAKSISVAKRFEFQSNFFDGEAKEYNTFMSLLDGAYDREEAFAIYHAYKSKFKWDNEDLKDELKALMYRKFN